MKPHDLTEYSPKELLGLHASIIEELNRRKIVKTNNNPIGDYTEWLVSEALELELATNSTVGYDATAKDGTRYQIKGRRITKLHGSRQLSAIRNLDAGKFDYLIAVVFSAQYEVIDAVLIPPDVVSEYATFQKHTHSHLLQVQGALLKDPRVQQITALK